MTGIRDTSKLLDRLGGRSRIDGDCLVWTGFQGRGGYGQVWVEGKSMRVHRAAWIARHGEIPADTPLVLHRCDNPPCWRDEHLFLGTQADNMADMENKGRGWHSAKTHCPAGHPYNELNTYWGKESRLCRECRLRHKRATQARRKAAAIS